jgi:hypothetical protein
MTEVSFDQSGIHGPTLRRVVTRALALFASAEIEYDKMSAQMDLVATHANGNPIDFERLLAADDFNFAHDVLGIYRHINRETGKLDDFFVPRFSRREMATA